MKSTPRQERVADQIRDVVAQAILRDVSDPRLARVHVQAVRLTPDLSQARVFWTCLIPQDDTAVQRQAFGRALDKAAGFFRQQLGKELRLRIVPQLSFEFDTSVERGRAMEAVLAGLTIPAPTSDEPSDF
jgi:ribosome-binding factor A